MGVRAAMAVALLASVLGGCFNVPPGTSLKPPPTTRMPIERVAWLDEVRITDPTVPRQQTVGEGFTISIRDFIERGGYFRTVKMLPGKAAPEDYVLRFEFDHFRQARRIHPLYVPAAFLTLTLYIWVGGPIVVDDVYLSGTLSVMRPDGTVIVRQTGSEEDRGWKGLYSKGYLTADRTDERTALVTELLGGAMAKLDQEGIR